MTHRLQRFLPSVLAATVATGAALVPNKNAPPTFYQDVQPFIQAHCFPCHSRSGSAPFPLESYEDVKNRAELVRFQVLAKSMPPTFFESHYGKLTQNSPATDDQIIMIQRWIQGGMEQGQKPTQQIEPKPDVTSATSTRFSPAKASLSKEEGPRYWVVYAIPVGTSDLQFDSLQLTPDNPQIVRNASIGFLPPNTKAKAERYETAGSLDLPANNLIGQWVPGYPDWRLPDGVSQKIPAGATLLVQLQIQPRGREESEGFELKVQAGTNKKATDWSKVTLTNEPFEIKPGGSPDYTLEYTLTKPQRLVQVIPEARFFAQYLLVTATTPDGKTTELIKSLRWDPYWPGNLQIPTAPEFPKGTILRATFSYSNDDRCAMNEGKAPTLITSGSKIDQEMCRLHLFLVDSD